MRKPIIGVMGAGDSASQIDIERALTVGKLIAENNWVLLSGGRNVGVMDAVNKGAKEAGGLTVGILTKATNEQTSEHVDIPILTGMGSARNSINVLSSDVVIAIGMGAGTASEIALAIKSKKHIILLNDSKESKDFFLKLDPKHTHIANTPEEAIENAKELLYSSSE